MTTRNSYRSAVRQVDRSACLLALGELHRDVCGFLDGGDEGYVAATLFVNEPKATAILVEALSRHEQVDGWFDERPGFSACAPALPCCVP